MRKTLVIWTALFGVGLFAAGVAMANNPPVANDATVTVPFGSAQSFTLTGSDPDLDTLTYTVISFPDNGVLSGTVPNLTYTPNVNFRGPDSLIFRVDDGHGGMADGVITFNVLPPPGNALFFIDGNPDGGSGVYGAGTVSLAGLSEGPHTLTIEATDSAGGTAFASSNFYIDNTPPTIAWTERPGFPNQIIPVKGTIDMKVYVEDNRGVNPTNDNLSIVRLYPPTGAPVPFVRTATWGVYAKLNFDTRTQPDGLSTFVAEAADLAGNLTNPPTSYQTLIDNHAPTNLTLNISSPPVTINSDNVVHGTIYISASATDATSGVKNIKLFTNSGGVDTLQGTFPGASFNNQPIITNVISDGLCTVRIEAYDQVDNMTALSQNVVIDNTGPNVQITTPANGASGIITLSEALVNATDSHNISARKLFLKQGAGSFNEIGMTYTAPNHWALNTPLDVAGSYTLRAYAEDGVGIAGQNDVNITLTGANHPPTAFDQPVTLAEDTPKTITLTASDPDAPTTLSYVIVTGPAHGTLSPGTSADHTYTPNADYNGTDSFTFKANDGSLDSNVATVSITVTGVNDKPVITNGPVTTAEDTAKAITITGSDVDGDAITFALVTGPAHGGLSGTIPNLTYTPNADYNGSDSIVVKANDGTVDSDPATINITVTPVNDAPVADPQSASTSENTPKALTLVATDVDGDLLTYSIASGPSHGAMSGSGAHVTYTPNGNYNGPDSFTFKANDGTVDSNAAAVTLTVTPVNQAPTANGQSVSTNEDTDLPITLTGSDPENSPLNYEITAQPAHGSLSGTLPNVIYTPGPDYNGSDGFSFRVNDGALFSNTAAINITVSPVNDAPIADSQNLGTNLNTALPVTLTGSDIDGDSLTFIKVTDPAHGAVTGSGANRTYTPTNGYVGNDSFLVKVNDGHVDSANAIIRVAVGGGSSGGNSAPTANAQSQSLSEDTFKDLTLTGSDPDGDPLTFIIVSNPANGTLSGSGANRRYTPHANFNGSDSFRFKVNDGLVDSLPVTVSLTVNPVNDAPVADGQNVETDYQQPLSIALTGSDVDGDSLTFATVSGPSHGNLSGSGANRTYTPNAGYSGPDSFTFKANDGTVDSSASAINITVNPNGSGGDNPPTANSQSQSTGEDTALGLTLTGSDPDSDPLTFIIVSEPAHGTLSGTGANRTYTPAANFHGADSFRFKVNDGLLDSAAATVSLTVTSVNDKPVADAETVETPQDTAILINFTGSDVDGDSLTFIPGTPSHGALSGSGASRTYTPSASFNGTDSFTLKANDGTIDSDPALIRILVGNVNGGGNHAPVANSQSPTTAEDTAHAITLTGTDADGDSLTYIVVGSPAHGALSGTAPNVTYTPAANYNGADSFTFKVNDGISDSGLAAVSITVTPVNDAPVANDDSSSTLEDTPKSLTMTGTDVDGDALTFAVVAGPTHGSLSGSGASRTYTPNANYNGPDSFTFKANDGTSDSNIATFGISIAAVNDPPVAFINPNPAVGPEDTALGITLQATDVENSPVTFTVLSSPTHGALSGTPPNLTYTPAANYNGPDSFTFKGNDGQDDGAAATANITVTPVNDAPVAQAGSGSLVKNTDKPITLAANDVDGDTLSYAIVGGPSNGVLLPGSGANRVYRPNSNFVGADSLTFKANDGTVDSNIATFSLNVVAGNNPPVAQDQPVTTAEDTPKAITLVATDVDGQTLTYAIVSGPAHGALSGTPPNVTYTPAPDYNGADVFTFKANDGIVDSNAGTVSLTITSVNDAPVVSIVTPANNAYLRGSVALTMLATDDTAVTEAKVKIDGGAEQVAGSSGVNLYTYNWNSNAASEASHTLQAIARDGAGLTTTQSVTVIVDRTAPLVPTFVPADGSTAQGMTNIQSTISDDRSLVFAEILIDGTRVTSRNVTGTSTPLSYSWDTLNFGEGTHQVTVHGVDAAGNERSVLHSITVRNLGGGNPLPDFDILGPANNAYVGGVITLHGKLTVGNSVTTGFTIDGGAFIPSTPPTGNVGDDFTKDIDTTDALNNLPDGSHIIEFLATTVDGTTRKDITIHVDNVAPTVQIDNPTINDTLFLVNNLLAQVNDGGNPIDEVRFQINTVDVAQRLGNADPLNTAYSFQMDTEALNPDGTRRWPDSPVSIYNYTLTVTAWDKARNFTTATRTFRVDNVNIPTSPNVVLTFNPTGFVAGDPNNDVRVTATNATISAASFNEQADHALSVKVKTNSSQTWATWTGPLRLVSNTIYFDRALPSNCRYQLTVRVLDTNNKLIQGSVEGIKAMKRDQGGSVSSADGLFTVSVPPNALERDIYLEMPLMTVRPSWMQEADLSFNQLYAGHQTVAGPYQVAGYLSMTGDPVYNETLDGDANVSHSVPLGSIPPTQQSLLRQIQEVRQTNDTNFWHPLGTSNNEAAQNASFRSVSGTTRVLGIYRVTMFAAPGSGITEVFNYANPFHPNEGPTTITYMLGDNSDVTIVLYDEIGNLVKKTEYAAGSPGGVQGPNSVTWDGRNGKGDFVASGSYIAQLLVKDSNGGHFKAKRKIGVVR